MDYRKYVVCTKGWVNKKSPKDRVEFRKLMLKRYPTPDHWKHVQFSNEVHFGYGPEQKA